MKNTLLVIIIGVLVMLSYHTVEQSAHWKRLYTTTSSQLDLATERLHETHTNTVKRSKQ